ncbi:MAG: acyl-CoA carboxylase subunit beta, partial [Arenicella sp.]|nr:acyl-CoA carboxylase subunit beta [Arenicella sp.]
IVGTKSEQAGMIKHGSKMVQAVNNLEVPRITLMTGASFGAGNYGMCGRGFFPDFLYTFPNARTGVMGGEQAAKTMSMVARAKAEALGKQADEEALAKQEKGLTHMFDSQSSAFYTSGHMMDDGIIDPRQTRNTLGFLLETVKEGRIRSVRPNTFGIARL